MVTILTKILPCHGIGTIVRILLAIKKFPILKNFAGILAKNIFLNYDKNITYTNLHPDIEVKKWAIIVWFEINNSDMGINFLANVFYNLHNMEELKDSVFKIYFSSKPYGLRNISSGSKIFSHT